MGTYSGALCITWRMGCIAGFLEDREGRYQNPVYAEAREVGWISVACIHHDKLLVDALRLSTLN